MDFSLKHFLPARLNVAFKQLTVFRPECAPERVPTAVSSTSLGFLDTWAARERGFIRKHDALMPAVDHLVDASVVEEALRERR